MRITPPFLAVLILCGFIESGFSASPAVDTMLVDSKTRGPQLSLPACISSDADIAKIQSVQIANSKTSHKYDGYRNNLHASTALELAARLAYAETLAANCTKHGEKFLELIVSVIGNRIRLRGGDVQSVIFQRDQFASSLNIYPESRYRDFLCPNDGTLWHSAFTKMRLKLEEPIPSTPIQNDAVNYYLYQHSARFKAPTWKLEEALIADKDLRKCIRVFRDTTWK